MLKEISVFVYKIIENKYISKENSVDLKALFSGEVDAKSIKKTVKRIKPSGRCVICDTNLADSGYYYAMQYTLKKSSFWSKEGNYTEYKIPKKHGGFRTLHEPCCNLKKEQKDIAKCISLIMTVPRHSAAFAYSKKRSPVDAIKRHQKAQSRWFLKIDLKSFFDNCNSDLIEKQLPKVYPFHAMSGDDMHKFLNIVTYHDCLPQGAPSSPIISNVIMIPFDHELSKVLRKDGFVYTRYADDLLISNKNKFNPKEIIAIIKQVMAENGYKFEINEEKTRFGNINGRNWNLGLMLNKDHNITVGHNNKKIMKAMLTKLMTDNSLSSHDRARIEGLFSYYRMVEKDYFEYLRSKYEAKFRPNT